MTSRGRVLSIPVVLLALVGVLTLAGCSSGSSSPTVANLGAGTAAGGGASPSGSVDRETAARQFASCMRTNGVPDFPDPTVDSNGNVRLGLGGGGAGIDRSNPATQKALTACRQYLQSLRPNFSPEQSQQLQDALLKYAQCMRTNGYQMADPDFSGDGGGFRAFGQINRSDPAFIKADAVCRPQTLGTLPFGGRGPGGGGPGGGGPGGGSQSPAPATTSSPGAGA